MIDIIVTGRDGTKRTITAGVGPSLMEVLRDEDTGVEGTCGGVCACGTCHVYVDAVWAPRLPAAKTDETDMLEAISGAVEVRPSSRLACQIELQDELSGIAVEIAPEV